MTAAAEEEEAQTREPWDGVMSFHFLVPTLRFEQASLQKVFQEEKLIIL